MVAFFTLDTNIAKCLPIQVQINNLLFQVLSMLAKAFWLKLGVQAAAVPITQVTRQIPAAVLVDIPEAR